MAALVPLNSERALPKLAAAGVEEIYVGFHDDAWTRRFGRTADLNRMSGFGESANPFSFEQMCDQLRKANELGIRPFVCFNSAAYSDEQIAFITSEYLPGIAQAQAAGVIVSSRALMPALVEAGLAPVISTIAGVFNEQLAAYYRDCGAKRLILPRDLSIDEIAGIMKAVPEVTYEVFLMRNGCVFSDSHCLGRHCAGKPSLCMALRTGEMDMRLVEPRRWTKSENWIEEADEFLDRAWENETLMNRYYHRRTCGLCALWQFEQLGVAAYKVVGRSDNLDDLCFDAGLVVRNSALARTCATEAEYLERMERPRFPETLCGYEGLSCYYPKKAYWEIW